MLYNALSMGKKTPKSVPSPWDFITPPEEDWATAIGNTHKKFGSDSACGSRDIMPARHTQTYSSQYFATAPTGEVITGKGCYTIQESTPEPVTIVINWVKVSCPTRHKIGHFGDVLHSQSFGAVLKKLAQPTTQEQSSLS